VQALGLQCTTVPGKAAARPFVIHNQAPAPGTPVAPGSAVEVHYDDTQLATLHRIKRIGTNVWVIGTDQAHIDNLMATGTNQNALGLAARLDLAAVTTRHPRQMATGTACGRGRRTG
jgi:hypothetical protein